MGLKLHLNLCKRLEKEDEWVRIGDCSKCAFDGLDYPCRISDDIKYFVVLCVSQWKTFLYSWEHATCCILLSPIVSRMDLELGRISFNGHGQWRRVWRVHMYSLQQLRDCGCVCTNGCNSEGWCMLRTVTGGKLNIMIHCLVLKSLARDIENAAPYVSTPAVHVF